MKQTYSLLDHTADIGIKVYGKTYENLFRNAAVGMFAVMGKLPRKVKKRSAQQLSLSLKANNIDELLHDWLSELLSLSDARGLIFDQFKIKQVNENSLSAIIGGMNRDEFNFERDIKAVTYHNLNVQKKTGQYYAEIIFDV